MKLWHISQTQNNGYDTFDSAVVAASSEEEAKATHPATGARSSEYWWEEEAEGYGCWCRTPDDVTVRLIGEALPGTLAGVICSSFIAG